MIEKLEINKKEGTVEIFVRLKKKQGPRTPGTIFSWKNALENVQKRFPELVFSNPLEAKSVLDNTKNLLEGTWIFPFTSRTKKEEPKKEEPKKEEPKKETFLFDNLKRNNKKQKSVKKIIEINKAHSESNKELRKNLTRPKEPATVEETSQSDQPAIVQEPTE